MPPVGAPRPDRKASAALLTSIEAGLRTNAGSSSDASQQEIAARLARMLWNGEPDAPLRDEAGRNRLTDAATLERHVKRMLADDRARAFVERFFVPWLGLDRLATAEPAQTAFPDYDVSLRDAMTRETELFLLSQLREDRDPIELWSANYTFLNEPLARHYGVAGVTGADFQRVASTPERAGLRRARECSPRGRSARSGGPSNGWRPAAVQRRPTPRRATAVPPAGSHSTGKTARRRRSGFRNART